MQIPNLRPMLLDVKTKESELRARRGDDHRVLARRARLEVSTVTKAIFQRYVNGELTMGELDTAIDHHLRIQTSREKS